MATKYNQQMMDPDLMDMVGLAQAGEAMGLNQPPPIAELVKLLGLASDMQGQEQELGLKRQALELEQQKQARMDPQMVAALMPLLFSNPEASRNLVNKAAPGILPAAQPNTVAPTGGESTGPSKLPKSRLNVKSQKAFTGYQPPMEDAQAVLDEQGNILNFVRPGTTDQVQNFVPDAASVGGWGASKYALARQMKALGQFLGLAAQDQNIQPY